MKKRILMVVTVLFLGLGFSCEDQLTDMTEEHIIQVEGENDDEDVEDALPGQHDGSTTTS